MPVTIKPTSQIKAKLGLEPDGRVQKFFTEECYKAMDDFVPYSGDTGRIHLRENVDIQSDSITYETPYARYQYYGQREDGSHKVKNYTTPGTGPYWDRRMVSAKIDQVIDAVQKEIDRGGR